MSFGRMVQRRRRLPAPLANVIKQLSSSDRPLRVTLELDKAQGKVLFRIGRDQLQLEQPMDPDEADGLAEALREGAAVLRSGSTTT